MTIPLGGCASAAPSGGLPMCPCRSVPCPRAAAAAGVHVIGFLKIIVSSVLVSRSWEAGDQSSTILTSLLKRLPFKTHFATQGLTQ